MESAGAVESLVIESGRRAESGAVMASIAAARVSATAPAGSCVDTEGRVEATTDRPRRHTVAII